MPFTLSHLALAAPMDTVLDRRLPVLALAAGTVAPDLELLFRGRLEPTVGHQTHGVVLLDLPLALALALWLGMLVVPAVVELLPERLLHLGPALRRETAVPLAAVRSPLGLARLVLAILIGAYSHLLLDSFTSPPAPGDRWSWWLTSFPFEIGTTTFALHSVLGWVSTVAGLAGTGFVVVRWIRNQPRRVPASVLLEPTAPALRRAGWAIVALTSLGFAAQNPFALIGEGPARPGRPDDLSTAMALWALAGALLALGLLGVVVRTGLAAHLSDRLAGFELTDADDPASSGIGDVLALPDSDDGDDGLASLGVDRAYDELASLTDEEEDEEDEEDDGYREDRSDAVDPGRADTDRRRGQGPGDGRDLVGPGVTPARDHVPERSDR